MEERLTAVLERLLSIPLESMQIALIEACDLVATQLRADKVDAFIYQPKIDSLKAIGTSTQPLSVKERQHGLHILPLANGGATVKVYQTGEPHLTGRLDEDRNEVLGIRETLGIRSQLGVALELAGKRVGVLMVASQQRDFFGAEDLRFAQTIVRWLSMLMHRAELVEKMTADAAAQGRRSAAEELVTLVAHDLRNHLGPIDLRLKLMMRRAERESRIADLADLTHALRSTARLEALITDILDVTRIDRGVFTVDASSIDLVALVQDVAHTLGTSARPVVVKASLPQLQVLADGARIRQCLENLISNAQQHSPEGAAVTVLVETEQRADQEMAKIDVLDEGPGVPTELLPHIFDRFVTSKSRNGGLGLGLFVAKRIAELHGGELEVERRPVGTRFCLTVPLLDSRASNG